MSPVSGDDRDRRESTDFRLETAEGDIHGLQLYVRGVPERVSALEAGQTDIKGTLNKLILSIVAGTLTLAVSAIAVVATIAAQG